MRHASWILLTACGTSGAPVDHAECTDRTMVAALSDYSSTFLGTLGATDFEGRASIDYGRDPALRSSGGKSFFLNRLDAMVFTLDAACATPQSKILLAPTGQSWNPQDVVSAPDGTLWVAVLQTTDLARAAFRSPER